MTKNLVVSLTKEQIEELKALSALIVPDSLKGKGGAVITPFIRMLISRNPAIIRDLANKLYQYADSIQEGD